MEERTVGIQKRLEQEEIKVSIVSLCKLTQKFRLYNSVLNRPTYKPPRILGAEHLRFIDDTMAQDQEMTGTHLTRVLQQKFPHPHSIHKYSEESTSRVGLDQQKNTLLCPHQGQKQRAVGKNNYKSTVTC